MIDISYWKKTKAFKDDSLTTELIDFDSEYVLLRTTIKHGFVGKRFLKALASPKAFLIESVIPNFFMEKLGLHDTYEKATSDNIGEIFVSKNGYLQRRKTP